MRWPSSATALLAITTILDGALGTLVTVTEYPKTCANTHRFQSTKVIHSTVTVSPQPFTDHDANHGTPFFLEVQVATGNARRRRAANPVYITSSGYTTDHADKAAQYVIKQGMLTTVAGGYVSADAGTQHMPFAISSSLAAWNTKFHVKGGMLSWENSFFDNGYATFFEILPSGHKKRGEIVVRLSGPTFNTWTPVVLAAMPATNATQSSSVTASTTPSNSAVASSSAAASNKSRTKHHHHHTDLSSSATMSTGTGHHHHHHHHYNQTQTQTGIYINSTGLTNIAKPTGTVTSPNGICGAVSGYNCYGSMFGNCCSVYGHCGNTTAYCSAGCQAEFGLCWRNASITSTSEMTSMTNTITSMLSSSTNTNASIFTPASTYTSHPSGAIGPVHISMNVTSSSTNGTTSTTSPLFTPPVSDALNVTSTATFLGSGSTLGSSTMTSPMSSASTAPPCPKNTTQLCNSNSTSTTCSSSNGTPYTNTCGVEYQGTTINTNNITGLPPHSKRATEYSLADCQTLCDYYTQCVAFNYVGDNCTLLSNVTGTTKTSSSQQAVGGRVPQQDVAAKTNPATTTTVSSTMQSSTSHSSTMQVVSAPETDVGGVTPPHSTYPTGSTVTPVGLFSPSSSTKTASSSTLTSDTTNPVSISTTSTVSSSSGSQSTTSPASNSGNTVSSSQTSTVSSPSSTSSSTKSTSGSTTSATSTVVTSSISKGSSSSTTTSLSSSMASAPSNPSSMTSTSSQTSSSSTQTGYLVLTSPTPCSFGEPALSNEDDSYCKIALPFSMQIYSQSDTNSYASTNGILAIKNGSSQYSNGQFPSSNIPPNTVAPFWDDLYLRGNSTPQDGIFYQFNALNTSITYEYYLNRGNPSGSVPTTNQIYHFTVAYDSTQPGIFTFTYYATGGSSDDGIYAAVGSQGVNTAGSEVGFTYSFQTASITPGLVVKCTTLSNSCAKVTS